MDKWKELLKAVGFEQRERTRRGGRHWEGSELINDWFQPDGNISTGGIPMKWGKLPDKTLDTIFKWIVPRVKVLTLTNSYKDWTATVNQGEMINGKVCAIGEANNPIDALIESFYQVLVEAHDG